MNLIWQKQESPGEDVVILACVILIQYRPVTDRQTDEHADRYADNGYYSAIHICDADML